MGSDVSSFLSDVVDVVTTPFKEIAKVLTGVLSDSAGAGVDAIVNAGDKIGIDSLAGDVVSGISSIGETAEHVITSGSDSIFGAINVMKYIPYAIVGFGGLFLLNNSDKILNIGSNQLNKRR